MNLPYGLCEATRSARKPANRYQKLLFVQENLMVTRLPKAYFVEGFCLGGAPGRIGFPSAKAMVMALTKFRLSLARQPLTVTLSPFCKEVLVQPARINPFGLPHSNSQF